MQILVNIPDEHKVDVCDFPDADATDSDTTTQHARNLFQIILYILFITHPKRKCLFKSRVVERRKNGRFGYPRIEDAKNFVTCCFFKRLLEAVSDRTKRTVFV